MVSHTSVDNVPLVEVVDRIENLSNSLCCVFLGKFALLANSVEQLSSSSELSDNIPFVLGHHVRPVRSDGRGVSPWTRTTRGT